MQLADQLKGDVVFLSPPWGGPSYLNEQVYDLETMLQPVPVSELLTAANKITKNVAVFLPRNSNTYPVSIILIIVLYKQIVSKLHHNMWVTNNKDINVEK